MAYMPIAFRRRRRILGTYRGAGTCCALRSCAVPIGPPPKPDADISVVLVATNCRGDIEANVEQLREQEGVSVEVVVVDNGSSDGTPEFLEQQPDLLLIANQENEWLNPARIRGLAHTTAPLILFFAPDTRMPPDTFRRLKEAID